MDRKLNLKSKLNRILNESNSAKGVELACVALVPLIVVSLGWRLAGNNSLARHCVVWVANILMLLAIWMGLRLRGQSWEHLGLSFQFPGWRGIIRNLWRSAGVLVAALGAFIVGSIPMVHLGFAVDKADMSSFSWLQGNFAMLMLSLPAIYLVSSFGEEIIYRGFLITRLDELGKNEDKSFASGSVFCSAIIFGLIHFTWGLMGIVQTGFMGLALAVSYVMLKRNLWPLALAHGYMDTLLIVQLYLSPSESTA